MLLNPHQRLSRNLIVVDFLWNFFELCLLLTLIVLDLMRVPLLLLLWFAKKVEYEDPLGFLFACKKRNRHPCTSLGLSGIVHERPLRRNVKGNCMATTRHEERRAHAVFVSLENGARKHPVRLQETTYCTLLQYRTTPSFIWRAYRPSGSYGAMTSSYCRSLWVSYNWKRKSVNRNNRHGQITPWKESIIVRFQLGCACDFFVRLRT